MTEIQGAQEADLLGLGDAGPAEVQAEGTPSPTSPAKERKILTLPDVTAAIKRAEQTGGGTIELLRKQGKPVDGAEIHIDSDEDLEQQVWGTKQ